MPTPDATRGLLAAGFLESVFHCPACGLGGTSLSRPALLAGKTCLDCGAPVVVSVLDRFPARKR
jgi:hypothetical protein